MTYRDAIRGWRLVQIVGALITGMDILCTVLNIQQTGVGLPGMLAYLWASEAITRTRYQQRLPAVALLLDQTNQRQPRRL